MAKEKILDAFIKEVPKRTYIRRFYNTDAEQVPEILKKGIVARGPYSFNKKDPYFDYRTVRTSANAGLLKGPVQVEMELPKRWYRDNITDGRGEYIGGGYDYTQRHVEEPYIQEGYPETWRDLQRLPVDDGGRISTFSRNIPRQFIKRICDERGNCYDPSQLYSLEDWELMEKFGR